jgi:hypothetical protein
MTAFADDLVILSKGESVAESENYMKLEMRKVMERAQNEQIKFNENKSKIMLMPRRRRRERNEIEIHVSNKPLTQINSIKSLVLYLIIN